MQMTTRMMMMMMMIMKMVCAGSVPDKQQACPSASCTCYGTDLVDCRSRRLTSVPTFKPSNIFYDKLLLSDNRIQHISASAFSGIQFSKLEVLDNPLKFVDSAAFVGLESTLTEVVLDLDETGAPEFPHTAMRRLRNLTTLKVADFAHPRLPPRALAGLRTLRELQLTPGNLETLTADDVVDQRTALEILDISDNKLTKFPTEAVRSLGALKVLNIRANLIDHLGGNSVTSSSLAELDVSHHALNRAGINSTAFDRVASTLRRLIMSQCHLEDRHAAAIARATGVNELVLSFNQLTSVRTFLAEMPNLERLDVQNNSVDALTTVSLPTARRLRALNLAYNPLTNIHPDAFVELRVLEDLKLDFARTVTPLTGRSFASQRWTLRNLSLRGVDLSRPQWSVIEGLGRLEMVSLSTCRLNNIPPFTFRHSGGRLHTLELTGNYIDRLDQRSLVGLASSLVRLNLNRNKLKTIDRCTFHHFTKLGPKSLILRSNPLTCDCGLHWLYNWTNGSRSFLYWRCSDDRLFERLAAADFENCTDDEDAEPCEDFTQTTTSTSVQPLVAIFLVNATATSFTVRWNVDVAALPAAGAGFRINCSCVESGLTVGMTVRERRFEGLSRGTKYRVCVSLEYFNWTDDVLSCLDVTTSTWFTDPRVMSIVVISSVLVLVVLPLSLVICLVVRRWRHKRRLRLAELAQPKITAGKTKRFMRQQQRPLSSDASGTDRVDARWKSRSVENNLDALHDDDDDRYRTLLALRLLQSRSLDNLVDGVNSAAPSYLMNQLYGLHDNVEQEVYDEINEAEVNDCQSPLMTENADV